MVVILLMLVVAVVVIVVVVVIVALRTIASEVYGNRSCGSWLR